MSHRAELLFLPCWILPFPWYFPRSSRGSCRDANTGQGSDDTQGMGTTPARGSVSSKSNSQSSRFSSPLLPRCAWLQKYNEEKMEALFVFPQA